MISNNTSMETKTALLVGASGLVGGHCLRFLLEESSYTRVVVLVRRPLSITHDKLVQHVVDFSEWETLGECLTADDVYCCLGTTIKKAGTEEAFRKVDFDYPIKIAALTQHCGANQFLIVTHWALIRIRAFFTIVLKEKWKKQSGKFLSRRLIYFALHFF